LKKTVIVVILFLAFLLIYFLQANFFNWFTIAGVKPNLFVILILFVGLFAGKNIGLTVGISFGIILDLFISRKIGVSGIMLGLIGFGGGYLDKNFSKESKITIMIMVMGSTLVYETGSYIINTLIFSSNFEIIPFIIKLIIETLYNAILTIIFYPLFQKAGYYIEEKFKGNKILTRYY